MDAIIGGTKLTSLPGMSDIEEHEVDTPFGAPSGAVKIGVCGGRKVAFLPRHGDPHMLAPHKINYRANLWALKEVGAKRVIAICTSGGIRDGFDAGTIVVPEQIIDYTYGRDHTFFDGTMGEPVKHIDVTLPFAMDLRDDLLRAVKAAGETVFEDGCYGCFNGPRLETAAEIRRLKNDGCDLVGQTGMPEATLAREIDLQYASICPIVNHAAGLGESATAVSHGDIVATRDGVFERVAKVVAAFVS